MNRLFFLFLLTVSPLLFTAVNAFAVEPTESTPLEAEADVSIEDQQVIELIEILQMMELLQDFQMMTFEEEDK